MSDAKIDSFKGEHHYLSNFYKLPKPLEWEGLAYPTSEHAFQAAKTLDPAERKKVRDASSPSSAKGLGRIVTLRPGWNDMRVAVMDEILAIKFSHPILKKWLLETGDAELVEGNTWSDFYWGVCKGRGENQLGKCLMRLRECAQEDRGHAVRACRTCCGGKLSHSSIISVMRCPCCVGGCWCRECHEINVTSKNKKGSDHG